MRYDYTKPKEPALNPADREAYAAYAKYCRSLGQEPTPFEVWLKVTATIHPQFNFPTGWSGERLKGSR